MQQILAEGLQRFNKRLLLGASAGVPRLFHAAHRTCRPLVAAVAVVLAAVAATALSAALLPGLRAGKQRDLEKRVQVGHHRGKPVFPQVGLPGDDGVLQDVVRPLLVLGVAEHVCRRDDDLEHLVQRCRVDERHELAPHREHRPREPLRPREDVVEEPRHLDVDAPELRPHEVEEAPEAAQRVLFDTLSCSRLVQPERQRQLRKRHLVVLEDDLLQKVHDAEKVRPQEVFNAPPRQPLERDNELERLLHVRPVFRVAQEKHEVAEDAREVCLEQLGKARTDFRGEDVEPLADLPLKPVACRGSAEAIGARDQAVGNDCREVLRAHLAHALPERKADV